MFLSRLCHVYTSSRLFTYLRFLLPLYMDSASCHLDFKFISPDNMSRPPPNDQRSKNIMLACQVSAPCGFVCLARGRVVQHCHRTDSTNLLGRMERLDPCLISADLSVSTRTPSTGDPRTRTPARGRANTRTPGRGGGGGTSTANPSKYNKTSLPEAFQPTWQSTEQNLKSSPEAFKQTDQPTQQSTNQPTYNLQNNPIIQPLEFFFNNTFLIF